MSDRVRFSDERLRHLAEQLIRPDVLVVGGEDQELARGTLGLLVRVGRLEEALRELIEAVAAERRWATGTTVHKGAQGALYATARIAAAALAGVETGDVREPAVSGTDAYALRRIVGLWLRTRLAFIDDSIGLSEHIVPKDMQPRMFQQLAADADHSDLLYRLFTGESVLPFAEWKARATRLDNPDPQKQ